ncbi:MAG TPA: helix-turn-helix domain-containing protein [Gammaproteobacteria bacterium]|jgi:hypothetical protein|nr:helix-turn-helix domain-containing protein [Gammaproteobacteria bacterium]
MITNKTQLIIEFYEAPPSALFNEKTIALIRCVSVSTLQNDRWRGGGIPYRKCGARVLYKKEDVMRWIESHELVKSTSEYDERENK